MAYDLRWFDDKHVDDRMIDGFHCDADGIGPIDAMLNWIRDFSMAEDGTLGREQYDSAMEADISTDEVIVSAYRVHEETWEIHVYVGDVDEAFMFDTKGGRP